MIDKLDLYLDSIVNSKSNLDYISIRRSKLAPIFQDNIFPRVRASVGNYSVRNLDYRMLDFLDNVPGIDRKTRMAVHSIVHDHKEVTKRFYDPYDTFGSLEHYGDPSGRSYSRNRFFRMARSKLVEAMGIDNHSFTPINVDHVEIGQVFTNKTTSAGAVASGSKVKNWDTILDTAKRMLGMIKRGVPFSQIWMPAMPFHRSQLHDLSDGDGFNLNYKKKNRLIWGVDASTVLIEALFARPLINYVKDSWFGYAGGKDPATLRYNIRMSSIDRDHWYSTDYSKFDQTIPDWLIHECFSIIRECYSSSYDPILRWIEYNFINTKLALPNGKILQVHKGIPSGSHFTQLVGSMANYLMMLTYLYHHYSQVCGSNDVHVLDGYVESYLGSTNVGSNLRMFVMGDDNLFFLREPIKLDDVSSYVHTVFGVIINVDKTVEGHDSKPKFLSRYWLGNGEDRDQIDLVLNLILPERIRDYDGYSPVDILFSLWFTFVYAFHAPRNNMMRFFGHEFRKAKQIGIGSVPISELPGSARVFGKGTLQQHRREAEFTVESTRAKF